MAYIGNSPENIQRGRRFVYEFKATAGQTVFSGTDLNNQTLDLLEENEMGVYLNGVRLADSDDYTVSGDTLTLVSAASLNDQLTVETQAEIANISSYTRAEADARYINYDGDIVAGDLQISGEVDAGSLIVDTDVLVVDATNDKVGIGNSSPENALHIASSDNAQMLVQNTSTGDASVKFNRSGQTFFMGIESSDNSFRISDTGTGVGDGDRLIIDTSGNPTFTGTAHTSLQVRSADLSTVAFMQTVQGTDIRIGGSTNHPVDLYSNGTRRVRITSTGNVGIGTSSPSNPLTVDGDNNSIRVRYSGNTNFRSDYVVASNGQTTLNSYKDGDNIWQPIRLQGSVVTHWTSGLERMRIDAGGNLILKATSDTGARLQINGADETSELLEVGITTGHAQFTATYASGGSNSAGFIFRTRNGTAGTNEKIRITPSGSLLVAKQAEEGNDVGVELRSNGSVIATVDNTLPMFINRKNGGDELLRFAFSNATVGSIQVKGSQNNIISVHSSTTSTSCGLGFYSDNTVRPVGNDGSDRDSLVDLGRSQTKFRNLYLSGGIVFDSRTNGLDDYEEGSFTPMTSTLAVVYHARYTKIGNLVTINCSFSMNSGQSRNFIQLPFIPANDGVGKNNATNDSVNNRYAGTVSYFTPAGGSTPVNLMLWHQGNQGAAAYFLSKSSDTQQSWPKTVDNTFGVIGVSFTYQTNS